MDVDPKSNTNIEIIAHLATITSSSVLILSVFWFGIYLATDGRAHGDLTRTNALILHELKQCVEDGVCNVSIAPPPKQDDDRKSNLIPHALHSK